MSSPTTFSATVADGNEGDLREWISLHMDDLDTPQEPESEPPLVVAAVAGNQQAIRMLLEGGASPLVTSPTCSLGYTALHHASQFGDTDCVGELLKWANEQDDREEAIAALVLACPKEDSAVNLGQSMTMYTAGGTTPLHLSAYSGHAAVAKMLVEACPEAKDAEDSNGMTALDVAMEEFACARSESARERFANVIRELGGTVPVLEEIAKLMVVAMGNDDKGENVEGLDDLFPAYRNSGGSWSSSKCDSDTAVPGFFSNPNWAKVLSPQKGNSSCEGGAAAGENSSSPPSSNMKGGNNDNNNNNNNNHSPPSINNHHSHNNKSNDHEPSSRHNEDNLLFVVRGDSGNNSSTGCDSAVPGGTVNVFHSALRFGAPTGGGVTRSASGGGEDISSATSTLSSVASRLRDMVIERRHQRQRLLRYRIESAQRARIEERRAAAQANLKKHYTPLHPHVYASDLPLSAFHPEAKTTTRAGIVAGGSGASTAAVGNKHNEEKKQEATKESRVLVTSADFMMEPLKDVFIFPMLSPEFCHSLWEELQAYETCAKEDDNLPLLYRHDGSLGSLQDCGFEPLFGALKESVLDPLLISHLPHLLHEDKELEIFNAFLVRSSFGSGETVRIHRDRADLTLSICLHRTEELIGSTTTFFRDPNTAGNGNETTAPSSSTDIPIGRAKGARVAPAPDASPAFSELRSSKTPVSTLTRKASSSITIPNNNSVSKSAPVINTPTSAALGAKNSSSDAIPSKPALVKKASFSEKDADIINPPDELIGDNNMKKGKNKSEDDDYCYFPAASSSTAAAADESKNHRNLHASLAFASSSSSAPSSSASSAASTTLMIDEPISSSASSNNNNNNISNSLSPALSGPPPPSSTRSAPAWSDKRGHPTDADAVYRVEHCIGCAVVHTHNQWYRNDPVQVGERASLIIWARFRDRVEGGMIGGNLH